MSFKRETNDLISSSHFILWQHFHLSFSFTMSITLLKVSISCKDILDSYKKSLIFIL
jgi:hypothetical protein